MANGYSVVPGYINPNNQKVLDKTNQEGTDNNQYFYDMECQDCGTVYKSNGTDNHHRQCPNENCPGHKARGTKPGKKQVLNF